MHAPRLPAAGSSPSSLAAPALLGSFAPPPATPWLLPALLHSLASPLSSSRSSTPPLFCLLCPASRLTRLLRIHSSVVYKKEIIEKQIKAHTTGAQNGVSPIKRGHLESDLLDAAIERDRSHKNICMADTTHHDPRPAFAVFPLFAPLRHPCFLFAL